VRQHKIQYWFQSLTQFIVPAETVRPSSLKTGSDSPVSMDSSTTLLPAMTLPCPEVYNVSKQYRVNQQDSSFIPS
jgi:hypothetical protein